MAGGRRCSSNLPARRCEPALLFDLWQAPPYGLRDGLFPVLAIAYVLSRADTLAIYLDEAFQPRLTSLLTDRLAQDPGCIRVRWSTVSDFHRRILSGVAEAIASHGGLPDGHTRCRTAGNRPRTCRRHHGPQALDPQDRPPVANRRAGPQPRQACERPEQVPARRYSGGLRRSQPYSGADQAGDAVPIISAVRSGLDELVGAYPGMLRELAATMLHELRIPGGTDPEITELHLRAETVRGLTGNYRLDAFATRPDELYAGPRKTSRASPA